MMCNTLYHYIIIYHNGPDEPDQLSVLLLGEVLLPLPADGVALIKQVNGLI